MKFKRIMAGIYAANCYIVWDDETKDGFVVDPGGDVDDILKIVHENSIKIEGILITHGHVDHVGGVHELKKVYDVPVYLNNKDKQRILNKDYIFELEEEEINTLKDAIDIEDGTVIKIGNMEITCLETPGHSPGGMSFKLENVIFTGDTIFLGSFGRCDLPGGDINALVSSIKSKIFVQDENTVLLPGHGKETSVKSEKNSNPIVSYFKMDR